jgi:hypothetical protein
MEKFAMGTTISHRTYYDWATVWAIEEPGFVPMQEQVVIFTIKSRSTVDPIQSPIQWVPGLFSFGVIGPEREADYSPLSSSEDKNTIDIPQFPHKSSWYVS